VTKVIEDVHSISQMIAAAIEEQGATINEIVKNVNNVTIGTQETALNVSESAQGLNQIAAEVGGVNRAVSDTSAGIARIKTSAADMAEMAEALAGIVDKFTL
jgi:methyl-accepting chemotaxis protein